MTDNKEQNQPSRKRLKLISCEIIYREICLLVAQSKHIIDVEFLRKGLHDAGQEKMSQTIQDAINTADKDGYDAILLGYGLCNNGIVDIKAINIPLVIPRAHDCISFFFGSRQEYEKYFSQNPGTYYRTTGWTERNDHQDDSIMHQLGLDNTYDEYVAKYGKENAEYILQSLGNWTDKYNYLVYIDMGLAIDEEYARLTELEAKEKSLQFKRLTGSMRILQALTNGNWDNGDFLIVKPGEKVVCDDKEHIITAVSSS